MHNLEHDLHTMCKILIRTMFFLLMKFGHGKSHFGYITVPSFMFYVDYHNLFFLFLFLSLLLPDIVLIGGRAEMDNNVNFEYSQLVQVHERQTDSQIFKRHVERRTSRITFEKNQ